VGIGGRLLGGGSQAAGAGLAARATGAMVPESGPSRTIDALGLASPVRATAPVPGARL